MFTEDFVHAVVESNMKACGVETHRVMSADSLYDAVAKSLYAIATSPVSIEYIKNALAD